MMQSKSPLWVVGETDDINKHYVFGAVLGEGGSGKAVEATARDPSAKHQRVAIKVISKASLSSAEFESLCNEVAIMKTLSHPNIVEMYGIYETASTVYLVMQLCPGGELYTRITEKSVYTEKDAAVVVLQIANALSYMHKHKIAHCDLKPDNFLFTDDTDQSLRVIDFGTAKFVRSNQPFTDKVGTAYYIAPEVIVKGSYKEQCDLWSLGVVVFVLLFGFPPFDAEDLNGPEIVKQLTAGFEPVTKPGRGPWFPADIPCSESARDLIAKLLTLNVAERLTAVEVMEHPWTTGEKADDQPRIRKVFKNLAQFAASTRLREHLLGVMVQSMGKQDLEYWRKKFESLDVNKDGKITVADLEVILEQELQEEQNNGGVAKPRLSDIDFDDYKAPANDAQSDALEPVSERAMENDAAAAAAVSTSNEKMTKKTMTKADLKKIIKIAGREGAIGYRELLEMVMHRWLSRTEARLYNEFCKLDHGRKGRIGPDELQRIIGDSVPREEIVAMIKEIDTTGAGTLNFDEFVGLWIKEGFRSDIFGGSRTAPPRGIGRTASGRVTAQVGSSRGLLTQRKAPVILGLRLANLEELPGAAKAGPNGEKETGCVVDKVVPGQAAALGGMLVGDVLVRANRSAVSSVQQFRLLQSTFVPGTQVLFHILRKNAMGQWMPQVLTIKLSMS